MQALSLLRPFLRRKEFSDVLTVTSYTTCHFSDKEHTQIHLKWFCPLSERLID